MGAKETTRARQKRKSELVYIHGGKCALCGYNKCVAALHFHHINPKEKSFGVSTGICRSLEQDAEESKKCVLVCANCHAEIHYRSITTELQTTFNQERYDEKVAENANKLYYCERCGKQITAKAKYCVDCYNFINRRVERPTREELKTLIRTMSMCAVGRLFGVCDNSVRKWCKAYGLPSKKTEIDKYSDEEWQKV